jgi:hypothetical protein
VGAPWDTNRLGKRDMVNSGDTIQDETAFLVICTRAHDTIIHRLIDGLYSKMQLSTGQSS